jgi:hypothetical protein
LVTSSLLLCTGDLRLVRRESTTPTSHKDVASGLLSCLCDSFMRESSDLGLIGG